MFPEHVCCRVTTFCVKVPKAEFESANSPSKGEMFSSYITRAKLDVVIGVEPISVGSEPTVRPIYQTTLILFNFQRSTNKLVRHENFEISACWLAVSYSSSELMPRLKLKKPHITVRLLRNKIFLYITSLQPPGIFTRNQRLMPLASCK